MVDYIPSYRDQLQNGIEPSWRDSLTDELYHHGIKGMHWGVRRPRNEDGILQGAGKGLFAKMKERRQRKNAAKEEYKSAIAKAKKDLQDWGNKANARHAKDARYRNSGQIGVEAEQAVSKYNAAKKAAKSKYKRTVNADKIAKLEQKRANAQRAAGRNAAMRKRLRKQNVAARILTAPVSGAAAGWQAFDQYRADRARRRINRLSN